jgi:hypothetical protein
MKMRSPAQEGDSTAARRPPNRPTSFLRRLRRDLTITILIKLALLSLLGFLFFSSSQRPAVDASAVAARILPSR